MNEHKRTVTLIRTSFIKYIDKNGALQNINIIITIGYHKLYIEMDIANMIKWSVVKCTNE